MPEVLLSKLTLPVEVSGTIQNVEFTLKDAKARELIAALGNAVKWLGVTTTELVDNVTTSPDIVVGAETKTATEGGMAQYNGEEFVYDGAKWQSIGKNNFGDLAFVSRAEGSYTPAGAVSATETTAAVTESITPFGTAGTVPSWTVSGETATFNPGTAATAGTPVTAVTAESVKSYSFSGTQATISVTAPQTP